jgi:hypothetical protein
MIARPHIFVATPCFGGSVTQGYMQSIIQLMQHAGAAGIDLSLGMLGNDALVTRCRNSLVGQFMELGTPTHLLFIDSDITFEPQQVTRMLAADLDVVGGMYPLKVLHWDVRAAARLRLGEAAETAAMLYVGVMCEGDALERHGDFATARYVGTGFMMIKRQTIERMIEGFPQTRYRTTHAYPLPKGPVHDRHALFDGSILAETGEYLSEDYTFCQRWRSLGGKVWLDTAGKLTHCGPYEFQGNPIVRWGVPNMAEAPNLSLTVSV